MTVEKTIGKMRTSAGNISFENGLYRFVTDIDDGARIVRGDDAQNRNVAGVGINLHFRDLRGIDE